MTRLPHFLCCALAALLLCAGPAPAAEPPAAPKAAAKAKTPRRARKAPAPAPAAESPRLTPQELSAPYSAMRPDNATRLPDFDPAPSTRPFAAPEKESPITVRLSREQVIDPLTGKDVTPKPDPAGAKESLKGGDVKGAVDKLGGKAEVQVEILKF